MGVVGFVDAVVATRGEELMEEGADEVCCTGLGANLAGLGANLAGLGANLAGLGANLAGLGANLAGLGTTDGAMDRPGGVEGTW